VAKLVWMKCFNCGEKGHPAKRCPHREHQQDGDDDPPLSGLTLDQACTTSEHKTKRIHKYFKVCLLDNGSQVNLVDSRLLSNLRDGSRAFRGMRGVSAHYAHGLPRWVF
jgi:hypothetical protein